MEWGIAENSSGGTNQVKTTNTAITENLTIQDFSLMKESSNNPQESIKEPF